ncbi:MAG: thioredoxin domain-containing protein [Planctomycetes bacterium]|nr:thioredoxin domain-containing protein [Planctomycetota bacterium]
MKHIAFFAFMFLASALPAQGGFLGVQLEDSDHPGALIAGVEQPSAGEIMGVLSGDRIVALGDRVVQSGPHLADLLGRKLPGEIIHITVVRGDQTLQLRGVLGRRPMPMPQPLLPQRFQGGSFELNLGQRDGKAYVRYPEDTPQKDREQLLKEAQDKYGEDVEVEFRGRGTEIRISRGNVGSLGREPFFPPGFLEEFPMDLEFPFELNSGSPETLLELLDSGELVPEHQFERRMETHEHGAEESTHHGSLGAAQKASQQSGKPVLLDFTASWCGPCQALDKEVFRNPDHAELMQQFEFVQVDIDAHRELAGEFEVRGIPDVRVLTPNGDPISAWTGFAGEEATVQRLEDALAQSGVEIDEEEELLRRMEEIQQRLRSMRGELKELRAQTKKE